MCHSMIEFIIDLVDKSRWNRNTILVFLSSRYYPNITGEESLSVLMEEQDGHKNDIRVYISKKLKGSPGRAVDELRQ